MIRKISTVGMNHDDWLANRKNSIGGSDAATIVGLNPYSCPYELWADKLSMIPPKEENEAMRIGHDLEGYVAKRFEEATGKKVRRENNILINSDLPFAHANVDRLIIGEKAGLECKTTNVLNLKKFSNGEFPPNYYVQCQHYMMVTGMPKWYLAVLILGKEFMWFEIDRHEEDIQALKQAEEEFWGYVERREEPPLDGSEACTNTVNALYSESDSDGTIDLTPLKQALEIRANVNAEINKLKSLKEEQDNKIKAYLQGSENGSCDGFKVSWKSCKRTSFDSKKFIKDHPEIDFSEYLKSASYRTFKVFADET